MRWSPSGCERRVHLRGRPARLPHPAARPLLVRRRRRDAVLHPDAQHGLVHDAVVGAAQPVVPPAHQLLEEPDRRAGLAEVRVLVRPRAHEALARHVERGQQAEDRIRVAVGPSAGREHRDVDRAVVLADRTVAPVVVAVLVAQPLGEPQPAVAQPLVPHLPPPLADHVRVGRAGVVGEHRRRPRQVVRQQAAAHVVHVVGVPVVGERHRRDRAEARGAPGGDLQRVEPAPRDAHHPRAAVAPRLGREPGEHLLGVAQLPLEVLVGEHALGVAAAAQVHPDPGEPVAGEVGVVHRVAHRGQVALPVRDELQDRRHRALVGVRGPPEPPRQVHPVRHGDPQPRLLDDPAREAVDHPHAANLMRRSSCRRFCGTSAPGWSISNGSAATACSNLRTRSSSLAPPR